jgi:hypothetical protein
MRALLLIAPLLLGAAQSTGKVSPTGDVSNSRVTATGSTTARALKDHLATLPDVQWDSVSVGSANVTASGATAARGLSIHLSSLPDAQVTIGSTGSVPQTLPAQLGDLDAEVARLLARPRFFSSLTGYTGAQAAPVGDNAAAITPVRPSVGEVYVAGLPVSCATNTARFGDSPPGLLVESSRIQYIAASGAPANQTITLPTGTFYLRIEGSGSIAVAAGTAVGTGLPVTVTDGAPASFTISTGGTVTTTVTGSPSFAQLENGAFPTSRIHSPAATARNLDNISIANPLRTADDWTIAMIAEPFLGQAWRAGTTRALFGIGTTTGPNSAYAAVDANGTVVFVVTDSTGTQKSAQASAYNLFADDFLMSDPHEFRFVNEGGELAIYVDGAMPAQRTYGTGTGKIATMPATISIGYAAAWASLNGIIRDFSVIARESREPAALDTNAIVTVGSSSTGNEHLALADRYPTRLGVKLGAPWVVTNQGASGRTIAEMVARWRGGMRRHGYGVVIALAGMNDYQLGYSAGATTPKLEAWFDAIRADGRRLIVVTLPPANDTASEYAIRAAINAWLVAYAAEHSLTLIDGAAVIADPADPKRMLAAYDNGNKHYNATGAEALATAVRTAFP